MSARRFLAAALLPIAYAGAFAQGERPWQRLQMPTAQQVSAAWKSPPPEYGPEPYYGMNGPVTLETVQRDLDTMKSLGYGAVTVQYGYGASFAYLSPEHMSFFRGFVAEAKKRGMRVWIVDDAGYPSGFAGGKFSQQHPELRMQALVVEKRLPAQGGSAIDETVSADAVAATAFNPGSEPVAVPIRDGHLRWTAPAGTWNVVVVAHAFRTSPTRSDTNPQRVKDGSQSLEDYMDPAATAQYLRFTHDAYKAAVGDEFGKTILGFRGDEPDYSIAGLPWTPKFFDRFKQEKGYDIQPFLAAFLQGREVVLTERQMRAHADYLDVFASMFRDGFFKPQADWCAANGMEYQVHLNHEEMELQLVRSEGEFFRAMRYVQLPGIDSIWHQIWTDTISDFPRLASSAAHVYGHPRAFTESFAAYRPEPDVTMARYILNEQFVRGVNLVETMYFPATSTPGRGGPAKYMRDPAYPALLDYTRRLSYLMSMGRPDASVALLLPSASLWMGDAAADDSFVSTERLLSEHQVDFDVIDEDAIASVLKPGQGTLETVSGNRFRAVIVPKARVLNVKTVERLRTFSAGGGHVLFLGGTPSILAEGTYLNGRAVGPEEFSWAMTANSQLAPTPTPPAQPPTTAPVAQEVPADLLAALKKTVSSEDLVLARPDVSVRYTHRTLRDAEVYLLFNESSALVHNEVTLRTSGQSGTKMVEVWDPQTGSVAPATGDAGNKGSARLRIELAPYATKVLVVR